MRLYVYIYIYKSIRLQKLYIPSDFIRVRERESCEIGLIKDFNKLKVAAIQREREREKEISLAAAAERELMGNSCFAGM